MVGGRGAIDERVYLCALTSSISPMLICDRCHFYGLFVKNLSVVMWQEKKIWAIMASRFPCSSHPSEGVCKFP
jgi:hypothetical protein